MHQRRIGNKLIQRRGLRNPPTATGGVVLMVSAAVLDR